MVCLDNKARFYSMCGFYSTADTSSTTVSWLAASRLLGGETTGDPLKLFGLVCLFYMLSDASVE